MAFKYLFGRTLKGTVDDDDRFALKDSTVVSGNPDKNVLASVLKTWIFKDSIANVKRFGAKGDESTNDTSSIQSAIDFVESMGGGFVFLPTGIYLISGLIIPSLVILKGEGWSSELKLLNGSNSDIIVTKNFSSLVGQNKWVTADGVQHGLGLSNLQINGNKANNSSGRGFVAYAKRMFITNVLIRDCAEEGWYSEAGDIPGQIDWTDLPESRISLWVRNCDTFGVVFRGPHDAVFEHLIANENGSTGVKFERSVGVYSGSCDVIFCHSYANDNVGVFVNEFNNIRAVHIICENNDSEGLRVEGFLSQFGLVQLFTNNKVNKNGQFVLSGTAEHNNIDQLQCKDNGQDTTNIKIAGNFNNILNIQAFGSGSSGTGVELSNDTVGNLIKGIIHDFSGASGVGLATGSNHEGNSLDLTIKACDTGFSYPSSGENNIYNIRIIANTGQAMINSAAQLSSENTEIFNVTGKDGSGNRISSVERKQAGNMIDLNIITKQTISIGHNLALIPRLRYYNDNIIHRV